MNNRAKNSALWNPAYDICPFEVATIYFNSLFSMAANDLIHFTLTFLQFFLKHLMILTPDLRSHHYMMLGVSETLRDTYVVLMQYW